MKVKRFNLLMVLLFCIPSLIRAQEELLDLIEEQQPDPISGYPAFKAMKIANLQSTKVASGGEWYMYVSHRFGSVREGLPTFFGLDNANTKIQMVYGLWDGFQLGLSRESLRQTYAGSLKWRLASQNDHFPLNITLYETVNLNTQLNKIRYPNMLFADRLSYASQLLISRRFSDKFSLQIAPGFIRQNLVWEYFQQHNQLTIGIGGRIKLSQRVSLNADYVLNLSRAAESVFNDPLSIGIDIETGGHVFQLLFSNAQSTNEPGFISNAEGSWWEGEIFFGFNIVRVF